MRHALRNLAVLALAFSGGMVTLAMANLLQPILASPAEAILSWLAVSVATLVLVPFASVVHDAIRIRRSRAYADQPQLPGVDSVASERAALRAGYTGPITHNRYLSRSRHAGVLPSSGRGEGTRLRSGDLGGRVNERAELDLSVSQRAAGLPRDATHSPR
jgi:hypothetical protein